MGLISTTCTSCSQDLEIDSKYAGKSVLCPYCQKLFVPPLPRSGFAVSGILLGVAAAIIEVLAIVYFLIGSSWQAGFLSAPRLHGIMIGVRIAGLLMSWLGISSSAYAMTQKRRRKGLAKWGIILNVSLNVLTCGFFVLAPKTAPNEPEPPTEEETYRVPHHGSREPGLPGTGEASLPAPRADSRLWRPARVKNPVPMLCVREAPGIGKALGKIPVTGQRRLPGYL